MTDLRIETAHGRHSITHTFTTGPLAGLTLVKGQIDTHPQHGEGVTFLVSDNPAMKRVVGKEKRAFVRLSSTPDLRAAHDEVKRRYAAEQAERSRKESDRHQRYQVAFDALKAQADALAATAIPAENLRVTFDQTGDLDGTPIGDWRLATGEKVPWPIVVHHGSVSADLPYGDDMTRSHTIGISSAPRAALEAHRAAEQQKQEAHEQKAHEKAAKRHACFDLARTTGQPVEIRRWGESVEEEDNSYTIVIELAMPDGSVRRENIRTH